MTERHYDDIVDCGTLTFICEKSNKKQREKNDKEMGHSVRHRSGRLSCICKWKQKM